MSAQVPDDIRFNGDGLVPAIVQNANNGQVLMLGYMNREALERTLTTGHAWFYSRSRAELWEKGATSGNYLNVRAVRADCDRDTILVLADPEGPTCHTGVPSCFIESLRGNGTAAEVSRELFEVIRSRQRERPEDSYVSGLFNAGRDRVAQKVGEEAVEVVIAAKNDDASRLVSEIADLWFHTYVLLADAGLTPDQIWEELGRRRR